MMRASSFQRRNLGMSLGTPPSGTAPCKSNCNRGSHHKQNQGDQPPGSLKTKHNDLVTKDIEIKLPLTNSRMKELQEQDPPVGQLRKQRSEKKLDRKHFTMEDEILRKKTVINSILYIPQWFQMC